MNTLNHATTGSLIAVVVGRPLLAIPLAFLSHFVLDAIPHNGYPDYGGYVEAIKHKWNTAATLSLDFVGIPLLIYLISGQTWVVWISAVIAISPDLKWPYRYWFFERNGQEPPKLDPVSKFHQWVQWCERPWGILIELAFAITMINILWRVV